MGLFVVLVVWVAYSLKYEPLSLTCPEVGNLGVRSIDVQLPVEDLEAALDRSKEAMNRDYLGSARCR